MFIFICIFSHPIESCIIYTIYYFFFGDHFIPKIDTAMSLLCTQYLINKGHVNFVVNRDCFCV